MTHDPLEALKKALALYRCAFKNEDLSAAVLATKLLIRKGDLERDELLKIIDRLLEMVGILGEQLPGQKPKVN